MARALKIVSLLVISCMFFACKEEKKEQRHVTKEDMIRYNQQLVHRDSCVIASYCRDQNLDSVPTASGLWQTIFEDGEGELIAKGDAVELGYVISDIDGTLYYDSQKDGNKKLSVGAGQDVMALDLALLGKRLHSRFTLIVMPDLAYGLLGDENRIEGRRILRYDVVVLDMARNANKK